jgi:hypothetical protein
MQVAPNAHARAHTHTHEGAPMLPRCDGMQIWELELDVESKDANNKQVGPVPSGGPRG